MASRKLESLLLTYLAGLPALTLIGFHLGIRLTPFHFWGWTAAFLVYSAVRSRGEGNSKGFILAAIAPIWCLLTAWFSGKNLDFSFDGWQYQGEGILQLMWGWNPFREAIVPDIWDTSWAVWANTMPKVGWTTGAVVARGLNSFEAAKFSSLYLIPIVFLAGFHTAYLTFRLERPMAIAVGTIAAVNPVVLSQLCIQYADGYSVSYAALAIFYTLDWSKDSTRPHAFKLGLALSLAGLTKFTSLFLVLALIVLILAQKIRKALPLGVTFATGGIAVLLIFGFNPFITNLVRYGNLNYPMSASRMIGGNFVGKHHHITEGAEGMIYTAHMPQNFVGRFRLYPFFYSIFSRSEHVSGSFGNRARLKVPLDVRLDEWRYLGISDNRVGGFGPLFSILFLISLGLLAGAFRQERTVGWMALAILLAAVSNPYNWWARYVGYFWQWTALGCLAAGILARTRPRLAKFSTAILVVLTVINSVPIAIVHLKHARAESKPKKAELLSLRNAGSFTTIDAYFGGIRGYLSEQNIPYLGLVYEDSFVKNHLLDSNLGLSDCIQRLYRFEKWSDPRFELMPPMRPRERVLWLNAHAHLANLPKERSPLFQSEGFWTLQRTAPAAEKLECAQKFLHATPKHFRTEPIF